MNDERELYGFTWPGKREAILEAGRPIDKVLRPCIEESENFGATENLYIEGDNLEAMKILQRSYMRKVKMIYIDPPYNTGHDFIYSDDFAHDEEEAKEEYGLFDGEGTRNFTVKNYRENTRANPRYHSDWCSMIYPRLRLASNLLRDDGVIFISIDDNEAPRLRMMCDEIFGENNFVAQLVWQKKYGPANDSNGISPTHEYILVYAENISCWTPGLIQRNEEQLSAYNNPDDDPRGKWRASDLSARTYSASCDYEITGPTGLVFNPPKGRSWIVNPKRYQELLADNRITFGVDNTGRPMQKKFLSEVKQGITPETWTPREKAGDNKEARYELKDIFPENIFDTPKPTRLLIYLMKIANLDSDSIVLDFFAGSSTTAHAVMSLNASDSGHRKFIMIQLPDPCPPSSEAAKAGYSTIADIGRERIRRASRKLAQDFPLTAGQTDSGFRTLRVDSPNFRDVFISPDDLESLDLDSLADNLKPDRSPLDLLFMCITDSGLPLSLPLDSENFSGFTIYTYGKGEIIACLDSALTEEVITHIAQLKPKRAVFRDSGFTDSRSRINLEQIFRYHSHDSQMIII